MSSDKDHEQELWRSYIRGSLDPETEARMEALLLGDEAAFSAYAAALASLETELPSPKDEAAYLQALLAKHPHTEPIKAPSGSRKAWTRHPLLHYAIAASLTALMLGSGFFDRIASEANQWLDRTHHTSLSERMMDATAGWIDAWKR